MKNAAVKKKSDSWFSITNRASASEADVLIYDEIGGFGVSAAEFIREVQAIEADTINLHLNTPGGDVFEGNAIYNAVKRLDAKVIAHIDGLAASIGSIIAMAGDEVRIAENAFMMIHNPGGLVMGGAADMRKVADTLDKVRDSLVRIYSRKSGKPAEEIIAMLDAETWFSGQEAIDAGLADTLTEAVEISACFDLTKFSHVPNAARNLFNRAPARKQEKRMATKPAITNELPLPDEGEAKEAFMTRCTTAEGGSDELCNLQWLVAHPEEATVEPAAEPAAPATAQMRNATPAKVHELKAAFPNHSGFVIDQIEAKATLTQAKAAFADVVVEENKALKGQLAAAVDKLRVLTKGADAIPGLVNSGATTVTAAVDASDPKTQAAQEWDENPDLHRRFSKKENYISVRAAELTGALRVSSR